MQVSSKVTGPGVWTSDAVSARAQALSERRACVVVACDTDGKNADCANCLRLEREVFSDPQFLGLMSVNSVYLVYVQAKQVEGRPYVSSVAGMLPYVSIYGPDGKLVARLTWTRDMDTPNSFNTLVQNQLVGASTRPTPTPKPAPGPIPAKRPSIWKRLFGWGSAVLVVGMLSGCMGGGYKGQMAYVHVDDMNVYLPAPTTSNSVAAASTDAPYGFMFVKQDQKIGASDVAPSLELSTTPDGIRAVSGAVAEGAISGATGGGPTVAKAVDPTTVQKGVDALRTAVLGPKEDKAPSP